MIPQVSPDQFEQARKRAFALWVEELEERAGPIAAGAKPAMEAAFSYGFADGFTFASERAFGRSKTIPLIPYQHQPAPRPGPLPRVG